MILYHFTAREYLDSIERDGLTKGDVPTGTQKGMNAVWLTTSRDAAGHGLGNPGELTDGDRAAFFQAYGRMPAQGLRFPDKRAVRITLKIKSNDRNLKKWMKWARKNVEPRMLKGLHASVEKRQPKTWYLYFGTIPPSAFEDVDLSVED
jgi:hypothetical protein